MLFRKSLAGLTLAAAMALPAQAEMTDAERREFRDEVREYLLENPEVLMEAIGVLEQRQAAEKLQDDQALVQVNADAIFNDEGSFVGGNPDGDITIVEFMDYNCGYCKRAFPEVDTLVRKDGNIRFIVKEFPILGESSVLASRFALATRMVEGDEAYEDVHNAMMSLRGGIAEAALMRLADDKGYDGDAIKAQMNSDEVNKVLADTQALAQRLQITGTPTFVMEDQMVRGYVPLENMVQIVAQLRAE